MSQTISTQNSAISKKYVIVSLSIIATISIIFKLYTMDFTNPLHSDPLDYALAAISHTAGDFSQSSHRGIGWSIFVSFFYNFINSDNFLVYSNTIRIISTAIGVSTIFMVYLVGRKFFNEKYSLVVAALFAFEPHLNYNSGFGLTEPFYHLAILGAFYFAINKNTKFIIPSLLIVGIIWWTRFNGITFFIILLIIFFVTKRNSPNFYRNLTIGILLFLIIIAPMLYQRSVQFDDPLYFYYSQYVFSGSWENAISIEYENTQSSALQFIDENGFPQFFKTYILDGLYNTFSTLWTLTFPYLFILVPFGIIFSFRAFDQEKNKISATWIMIILSIGTLIITFSIIPEKRYLYYIYPFLIILSVIPIQRVTEYGLSTFSFTQKQKSIFLVIILIIALLLSIWFTARYEPTDNSFENEKYRFAQFAATNLDGNILREFGDSFDYLSTVYVEKSPGGFKNCEVEFSKNMCNYDKKNGFLKRITITGDSVTEIISKGQDYELKYIIANQKENEFHGFIDKIYSNEKDYPYLNKIFDSEKENYEKLKIKIFEIDYEKFNLLRE